MYLSFLNQIENKLEEKAVSNKQQVAFQKQNEEKEKAFAFLDEARIKMHSENAKK